MKFGKLAMFALSLTVAATLLVGCGGGEGGSGAGAQFDESKAFSVVAREPGSGTRGAFIELFNVEVRGSGGARKDLTTTEAIVSNKTDVMLTNIAGNKYAIGYVSVGSLNETVKALEIDGAAATVANIQNNTYKIKRPFIIATKGQPKDLKKDFIDYILSKEGQEVVVTNNYVSIDEQMDNFTSSKLEGKLVVAGSSSVTPVMEKLKEDYALLNPNARIEIQMTDSTAGLRALSDATCDIAMSSRDLTDEEKTQLTPLLIAQDGIAVIVGKDNPYSGMTSEQVRQIFTGEIKNWSELP